MEALTLIYFEGCPKADTARDLLREAGHPFTEARQEELAEGHPLRAYTSPTILLGKRVLFGSAAGEAGCSIEPLDRARVLSNLREAAGGYD